MIEGCATPQGTMRFAKRQTRVNLDNFRQFQELYLSNVGMGTYLGQPDEQTDLLVGDAVKKSILGGINVIDSAINYRSQKAERSVGRALSDLIKNSQISRDEIFISTKNGYVTNDADVNEDFWEYVKKEYVKNKIIQNNDISSGYHCMTISYLEDQLNRSRKNLGLDCIDLMYIHNAVEGQIQDISMEFFLEKLFSVFEFFEKQRKNKLIKFYGMATWDCFRVDENDKQYLSLSKVVEMAQQVGGKDHGFKFIQLPFNMYLDQAYMIQNQHFGGKKASILEAAKFYNIGVFTSVPFMQGRLLSPGVMPEFNKLKPSVRALQFIRSTPGVLAPIVGQKLPQHVEENLEAMNIPPIPENEFYELVKKLTT